MDHEVEKKPDTFAAVAPKQAPAVTVAAITEPSEEVYFDLVARTSNCLGENIWFGGKLVSEEKISLASSGAITEAKVYRIAELTATGLNSNKNYQVSNDKNTLKAVTGSQGEVYIQLTQGELLLLPQEDEQPLVLAYQPNPTDGYYDGMPGRWSCE
ncbi:hypothetical protein [Pontibacter akesuensis]|nr:hypothetical protein [Pontibacter akesuensis]GHA65841.1 hypothetical protein GCM10007389_18500 [Pontibacter akesuensis]